MESLRIYLLVGWLLIGFITELITNRQLRLWVVFSFNYFSDKKRITKEFETKSDEDKRDYWLNNFVLRKPRYWFQRSMEKYIRENYINDIVAEYGSI